MDISLIEKSLLKGTWHTSLSDPQNELSVLAESVVNGDFHSALTSPSAARLLPSVHIIEGTDINHSLIPQDELAYLCLGIASLHAFVQENWTGPNLHFSPIDLLILKNDNEQELNDKIIPLLAYGGEPAYHLTQHTAFLRLALIIFAHSFVHIKSGHWWQLRARLIHQQVLDEPVAIPCPSLDSVAELTANDPELTGRLMLEQGLLEHTFGHDRLAAELFVKAAKETGLQYELTGALGKRTKFQVNELSQLVLLAESSLAVVRDESVIRNSKPTPETLPLNDDTLLEQTEFTSTSTGSTSALSHISPSNQPPLHPLDQSILLALCLNISNTSPTHGLTTSQMAPYITRVITQPANWSVHTMSLLLRSRIESNRTRTVERATLQLQALVDQMPVTDETVANVGERLRYFHEIPLPSKFNLEKELAKAFMSLGVRKSALEIFERLEMWQDVVSCLVALELKERAVTILWDLVEGRKEDDSEKRRRVFDKARLAKLYCILGDLAENDQPKENEWDQVRYYLHAWTLSGHTSARSMRSLGGLYFSRGDYKRAVACLRRAVKISPLIGKVWFLLGCAHVRLEYWASARRAFARCVAIDDEDGESWNNLASVYLRMGEIPAGTLNGDWDEEAHEFDQEIDGVPTDDKSEKEAYDEEQDPSTDSTKVPFANKILAFRALKQGLRFSYDNWRMWNNYMIIAIDVGELSEAARALGRIVEEKTMRSSSDSAEKADLVDEDVLDRLVVALTRREFSSNDELSEEEAAEHRSLLRAVTDLFDRAILPRVSSSPRVFRAHARLLTWQGRYPDALQAHLNAFRCGASSNDQVDIDPVVWREALAEVVDIVDVLRNFGPKVVGSGWKLQCRTIIRTFMSRTKESFGEEPEWNQLVELLDDLRSV